VTAGGSQLVAGVDIATQEVRVTVTDGAGQVAAEARARLPSPTSPRPGWQEQDANGWYPSVVKALRQATEALGDDSDRVVALSVSATSGTVVLADAQGEPLGTALMYGDLRADAEAENAQEAGRDRWDSLGLHIAASFGLPKLAWMLSQADNSQGAKVAWHVPDLVVAHLIGERPATDTSHALKSGYDPLRREWAEEALDALGIRRDLLPEVVAPTTVLGSVTPEAASATGLPAGCEVRAGMTDSCASQLAAGADVPGRFVTVLGTTMAVKGATDDLLRDPTGAVYSHRHPEGWWLPGGASNTGGAALEERLAPDGDREAEREAGADLSELDRQAADRGPAGCVVYPLTREGERFPFVAPHASGFCLGSPSDDVEHHRAILEGVAFVERLSYAHLLDLGADLEPPIAAAGRSRRSAVWNELRATVLGLPLIVRPRAETSFGACILAAAGTLHDGLSQAARAMVQAGDEVRPRQDDRDALERNFGLFLDELCERGWIGDRLREVAWAGLD
jgi:sugar (pentulose or hexulose) kinase